jgi:hypothetical protein
MDVAVPTISHPSYEALEKKGFVETHNTNIEKESLSFVGLSETAFGNAVEAALEYHRRGYIVTPLHEKRPILGRWHKRILKENELPHYFRDKRNIGIVLGDPAGIVDVDLDNPVAGVVADRLLPDTVQSGRKKSPRSHCWFLCNRAPATRKYTLPRLMADRLRLEPGESALVELRSTGQQTMVAPSIHPVDGDRCIWYPGEIREMDGGELADLVLDVAVAALQALNRPLGSREWFAIHASSYLSPRVGAERAQRIVEAASMAFDDEEHDERMWALRSSLQKSISDPKIEAALVAELERLAPGVPDRICRWCARSRREQGGAR